MHAAARVLGEIVVAKCPQQSNGFDCGIHVIANSLFKMTKIDIPANHNCEIWRSVCHALLSQDAPKMTSVVMQDNLDIDDKIILQLHDTLWRDVDEKHQLARDTVEHVQARRTRTNMQIQDARPIETLLTCLSQSNSENITVLSDDIQDISSQGEALQKSIGASDDQQSHLILKYFLFDHRPTLRKSLEDYEKLPCKLQGRRHFLQTSASGLTTARTQLEG